MYKQRKIAVVVPAYNEQDHVLQVVKSIPMWVDYVIVVDDCSQDQTATKIKALLNTRISLIKNGRNQGVGGATMLGFQQAMLYNVDIVVKVDGDGQMPLDHLPALLDALVEQGYGYAKGNRFLNSHTLQNMPKVRLFGNLMLTFLNKMASGYWHIFDPQNGFVAIKTKWLQALNLDKIHPRFFFENDMLVSLNMMDVRVKDVPMPTVYGNETTHIRVGTIFRTFPWLFFKRFWRRIYFKYVLQDFSPIALFMFVGTILTLWGAGFGVYLWIMSAAITKVPTTTGTVMLAVLPFIIGFQLLLQALVLDIYESPR